MPTIERLMLDGQPEPVSHYCHVTKAGNLVWVSGTVGIASDGRIPGDVVEQFEVAIANMDTCLKAVGAGAEQVVKVTVYLTDVADRKKINPIRQRYFGAPACSRQIPKSSCSTSRPITSTSNRSIGSRIISGVIPVRFS